MTFSMAHQYGMLASVLKLVSTSVLTRDESEWTYQLYRTLTGAAPATELESHCSGLRRQLGLKLHEMQWKAYEAITTARKVGLIV